MARSMIIDLANFQQFTAINLLVDPGHIGGPKVIPSCAEVKLVFALEDGKFGNIILTGRYAGSFNFTTTQATALWTALSSGAAWTALAGFLATSTNFGAVTLRDLNVPNAPIIPSGGTGNAPGTSASPALPNEVAIVVTKRTSRTGPGYRGRLYVPGFATNALGAGNIVAAGAVTAVQNWANTIAGAFTAQGLTHVLGQPARAAYTGRTGTQHPARPAQSTDVSSVTVRDNHWDTQRRRGLK